MASSAPYTPTSGMKSFFLGNEDEKNDMDKVRWEYTIFDATPTLLLVPLSSDPVAVLVCDFPLIVRSGMTIAELAEQNSMPLQLNGIRDGHRLPSFITIRTNVNLARNPNTGPTEGVSLPIFHTHGVQRTSRPQMSIISKRINKALQGIVQYYPDYPPETFEASTLEIDEPYMLLVHHHEEIYRSQKLRILANFLRRHCGIESGSSDTVDYGSLWHMFRPGTDVYAQSGQESHMCVVSGIRPVEEFDDSGWKTPHTPRAWILDLWYLDTDGSRVARVPVRHHIPRFSGVTPIISLLVCPASIWDASADSGTRRKQIEERGHLHVEALKVGHLHVQRNTLSDSSIPGGKVVIDYAHVGDRELESMRYKWPDFDLLHDGYDKYSHYSQIYLNEGYASRLGPEPQMNMDARRKAQSAAHVNIATDRMAGTINIEEGIPVAISTAHMEGHINITSAKAQEVVKKESRAREVNPLERLLGISELDDHQLLLLYPRAPAYDLNIKEWRLISTTSIRKIEESNAIDNLVLNDAMLETIRALSDRQNSLATTWPVDHVAGKGIGQIILLHGPPGVGKTYTVESIAEWLQRPLLALTVADLGILETKVEQALVEWFELAEAWNAVLLIDEADLFLERRMNRDIARNGLVTAFLRRMEYFKGLLFLTTNRVGQIDDAFISRVHVAFEYKRLDKSAREKIWKNFFQKLGRERPDDIEIEKSARKYALDCDLELNGREIRNAIQTAIALAAAEARDKRKTAIVVTERIITRVLDMSKSFHDYVYKIRQEDEADRSAARGDRYDYQIVNSR